MGPLALLAPLVLIQASPNKLTPTQPSLHWQTSTQAKSSKVNNNKMQHYVHPSFCLPTSGLTLTHRGFSILYCQRVESFVFEARLHHYWPFVIKAAVRDEVLQQGAVPEALVVEVHCAQKSPPTRGRSLRPFVVKVRCTRQSPLTRCSLLRPSVVKVCCARQSPQTRGSSSGHSWSKSAARDKDLQWGAVSEALMVKVRYVRQSPSARDKSLRPLQSKSAVRDKVLRQGAKYEAYPGQVHCAWQGPPLRGRHWDTMSNLPN